MAPSTDRTWPIVLPARLEGGQIRIAKATLEKRLRGRRDCELELIIDRKHATRSLAQNRLYWKVYVGLIAEHTGYTPEEVHELLKAKFLPKKFTLADTQGEITDQFVIGRSTTRLNKIEFGQYLEEIAKWAAESLGIVMPEATPNELDDRKGSQAVAS